VRTRSENSAWASLTLVFESKSGNMFTPANLASMARVENYFLGESGPRPP